MENPESKKFLVYIQLTEESGIYSVFKKKQNFSPEI